jgi:transposase
MFRASTQKAITDSQAQLRKDYTSTMRNHPVVGHWDGFQFTDEAHMSLQDFSQAWILRVIGTRTNPENMVMKPPITANVVHFAGWITYHEKAEELIFYNDKYDDYIPPVSPPKPKFRPTTKTRDQYNDRVRHWEAEKAREPEVKKPGNSMRASYYTDNILPIYCDAYDSMKARANQLRQHVPRYNRNAFYLIKDNDSSHSTHNPSSLPAVYKLRRGVLTVLHPPNSLDLNPIEAIWNIIKNKVKEYLDNINSITELKAALQREWKAVSQEEIQQRIDEMPGRCHKVFEHPKVRVKNKCW